MSMRQVFAEVHVVLFVFMKRGESEMAENAPFMLFILQKHIVLLL